MKKTRRHTFKQADLLISEDDVHPPLSGRGVSDLGKMFAPKRESIRAMILELRTKLRWSQEFAAAVLGVPPTTLRSWERGARNPCGSARKLVWFLHHTLLCKDRRVGNCWDLAVWGLTDRLHPPGKPFELVPTTRMTREEVREQVADAIRAERIEADGAGNFDAAQSAPESGTASLQSL